MKRPRPDRLETIRKLRLGDIQRLLRHRCGPILPDDDAGREYLWELLLVISVGPNADMKIPKAIELWAPWMEQEEAAQVIGDINRKPIRDRWRNGTELGQHLNLTNAEREHLRLWQIPAVDLTPEQAAEWRREKERVRRRKKRKRQPRAEYLAAHSVNRTKPWEKEGISRAKWYRQCKHQIERAVLSAA